MNESQPIIPPDAVAAKARNREVIDGLVNQLDAVNVGIIAKCAASECGHRRDPVAIEAVAKADAGDVRVVAAAFGFIASPNVDGGYVDCLYENVIPPLDNESPQVRAAFKLGRLACLGARQSKLSLEM